MLRGQQGYRGLGASRGVQGIVGLLGYGSSQECIGG